MIATSLRALERFLLPNACIVCGRSVPTGEPDALVCSVCRVRARRMSRGCDRCGQPMPPVGPCRFCADWSSSLVRVRSAYWLERETRAIVHHLKYEHCPGLAHLVGDLTATAVSRPRGGWLIPIPVGARRLKDRGYNQTDLIARRLSARWQLPVASQALSRVRDTPSQTALTPEARLANVAGAFTARPAPAPAQLAVDPEASSAILVDDVLTTGATLDAAANALVTAGWRTVTAVTFARAMPFASRVFADLR